MSRRYGGMETEIQSRPEEPPPANEDDKQPLLWEAMGLRGGVSGVREWNGNTSAATWQDEERAGDGVGAALESRMGDTSLPAAAVRGRGTQGLLFPLSSLSPRRSLVFPQQTVGTMKAACSPPLRKGLSILDLSDPEWPNQPSHENQVNDLLPLALLLVKWVTAIISISKTEGESNGERGTFLTCCWGDFASDSASSYKMH